MLDKKTKKPFNNFSPNSSRGNKNLRKEDYNFKTKKSSMPNKLNSSQNNIAKRWRKSWSPMPCCKKGKKYNINKSKNKQTIAKDRSKKDREFKQRKRRGKNNLNSRKEEKLDKPMRSSNCKSRKACWRKYKLKSKISSEFRNKEKRKWKKNITRKLSKELTKSKTLKESWKFNNTKKINYCRKYKRKCSKPKLLKIKDSNYSIKGNWWKNKYKGKRGKCSKKLKS